MRSLKTSKSKKDTVKIDILRKKMIEDSPIRI